jgi:signal transduction histidine kinase
MERRHKFSLGYFLAAMLMLFWLQSILAPQAQQISYAQFKQYLYADQIERVLISEDLMRGTLKPGAVEEGQSREFTTVRITDDVGEISEKLRVIEEASPDRPEGRIDLVEAVREAAADVDGSDVTVTVETPAEAWIRADRSVEYPIREVFENAVTHNDGATRRVEATIRENGTTTSLEVTDNGPGIPPDERAVLQAEEETALSHASSIGLWLVKWMCETQGGTVRFEADDDGTTVRLRFESTAPPATPTR